MYLLFANTFYFFPYTTQFNYIFFSFALWMRVYLCLCVCLIYDKMPFTFFKRRIFFCTHIRFASVCVCMRVYDVYVCACMCVDEFSHSIIIYHIHCCVYFCTFTNFTLRFTIIIDYFARRVLSLWLVFVFFFQFRGRQQIVIRVFVMVRAARNKQEKR